MAALLLTQLTAQMIAAHVRWALAQTNLASALEGVVPRLVFDHVAGTVASNVDLLNSMLEVGDGSGTVSEEVRWMRHASANACGFCRMIVTRHVGEAGTFYGSKEAAEGVVGRRGQARGSRSVGDKYHDHCHCTAVVDLQVG